MEQGLVHALNNTYYFVRLLPDSCNGQNTNKIWHAGKHHLDENEMCTVVSTRRKKEVRKMTIKPTDPTDASLSLAYKVKKMTGKLNFPSNTRRAYKVPPTGGGIRKEAWKLSENPRRLSSRAFFYASCAIRMFIFRPGGRVENLFCRFQPLP